LSIDLKGVIYINIKLLDCIKNAATLIQNEEVLNLLKEGNLEDLSDFSDARRDLDLLVECGNMVYSELAGEYLPLYSSQSFKNESGNIEFKDFNKNVVEINSVTDLNGNKLYFKVYPQSLSTLRGSVIVSFSYLPDKVGVYDALDYHAGRLSERIVAYGICAEYSIIKGMFNDATYFDKKFRDSLLNACRRKNILIPPRRWL